MVIRLSQLITLRSFTRSPGECDPKLGRLVACQPKWPLAGPSRRRDNGVGLPADADAFLAFVSAWRRGPLLKGRVPSLRARRTDFTVPTGPPGRPTQPTYPT